MMGREGRCNIGNSAQKKKKGEEAATRYIY
jgi:hypothetical protein